MALAPCIIMIWGWSLSQETQHYTHPLKPSDSPKGRGDCRDLTFPVGVYASHPATMQVLAAVKGLVYGGIAIVSTIHSPTAFCFSLFDSLTLLLSGRVIYSGDSGEAAAIPPAVSVHAPTKATCLHLCGSWTRAQEAMKPRGMVMSYPEAVLQTFGSCLSEAWIPPERLQTIVIRLQISSHPCESCPT